MFNPSREVPTFAHFHCCECGNLFAQAPGPTPCPLCGHSYVEWLDFEDFAHVGAEAVIEGRKQRVERSMEKEGR
jgi:uncharacterized Zn finger protein (UPF0148 family)